MGVSGASLYSAYVCASPRRRRCAASWARKKRRPPPTHPHLKIVDNSRLRPALEVAVSRVFQGFSRRLPSHPALSRISQISCLPTPTVFFSHLVRIRRPDIQSCKGPSKRLCHRCRRPHDLCIGGRGRQTRQNMFSGWVVLIHKDHLPCPQYSTI